MTPTEASARSMTKSTKDSDRLIAGAVAFVAIVIGFVIAASAESPPPAQTTSAVPALTAAEEQAKTCAWYGQLGKQMAQAKARAYTYQQQVDKFRAQFSDSGMEEIKLQLDYVYASRESPETLGAEFKVICDVRYHNDRR